jgi:uncharacterized membrane protein
MHPIKTLLEFLGDKVSMMLEFTSVVCIVVGFIAALILLLKSKKLKSTPLHRRLKLTFGGWLALALEFQLAADIVNTTITPTYENLIQLAAVAIIRTFLTYFLNREIREDLEMLKIKTEADSQDGPNNQQIQKL